MEIEQLKYINELNTESFIHMLDDPTECYKFYWLDALLNIFSLGKSEINFDDVLNKMIVDAWYSVVEYHLHLGPKNASGKIMNSLERAAIKLAQVSGLPGDADEPSIIENIQAHEKEILDEKKQLVLNVPYRLLSSFMPEIGGNDKLWDQRKRMIAYIDALNKKESIPYKIIDGIGLNKKVVISPEWQMFLKDNYVTIAGWIEMKKVKYLQNRNPGVPGLIFKLEPQKEKQRKLKYVRELWNSISEIVPIIDIYTDKPIKKNVFDVDHFIPWSYIANDELWNLMPMNSSLNSSKSNNLPKWDRYFKLFAHNQFIMNQLVLSNGSVKTIFLKCQRDNLVMPWSLEELYLQGQQEEVFISVLEKNLRPIYDSARMQGYNIWSA
ncbi:HNH endonuclease [Hathewaya proteolytica DSM 3090]|uniref:HNH endonuclease n=1 Tax=Hathewaya proteolytica DSM 3090 TaxID=1121331 RepID=A0A1M6LSN9_9CLOT|nr:HNH endonuclease domain-containing protein [Hathewaya proteolytica]SHJ74209.1 HNH endonuclease [Hathewaya proteolytica DSM 3090]